MTSHEQQIRNLLNHRDGVLVLGQSHGPTDDEFLRFSDRLAQFLDPPSANSRTSDDFVPVGRFYRRSECLEAYRVLIDEFSVEFARFENDFQDSFQQRSIAIDPHRKMVVGNLRARAEHAQNLLRMFEAAHSGLFERVDADDRATIAPATGKGSQHTWMIRARVLADDQNQVSLIEARKAYSPFSDTNDGGESVTA